MRSLSGLVLALCTLLAVGCGNTEPQPIDITGTATFDGQPIVYGTVELIPNAAKQMTGPAGNAEIVDGKFDTKTGGRGVFPGAYLARVTAYEEPIPPGSNDETVVSTAKPPIFVNFEVEIDVKAEENAIVVPASAKGAGLKGKRTVPANNP